MIFGKHEYIAVLVKEIAYHRMNGSVVRAVPGTYVLVDTENEIALVGTDHVQVGRSEYVIVAPPEVAC